MAQRLQSLPGVSGQGKQAQPCGPMAPQLSCALSLHELGVDSVSFVPASQHGPRPVGGMGIRDHMEPGGVLQFTSNLSEPAVFPPLASHASPESPSSASSPPSSASSPPSSASSPPSSASSPPSSASSASSVSSASSTSSVRTVEVTSNGRLLVYLRALLHEHWVLDW